MMMMMMLLMMLMLCMVEGGSRILVKQGPYTHVYNTRGTPVDWYLNDHTIVNGPGGWFVFGITHTNPVNGHEENLDLAFAGLNVTQEGAFVRHSFSLGAKFPPETQLWAPHVVPFQDRWYMFYCGCGVDETRYHIRWAVSWDLRQWTRLGTLFTSGWDGRDPMVMNLGPKFNNTWAIYYCATTPDAGRNVTHVTYVRTNPHITNGQGWSEPHIAFWALNDGSPFGGPTESPFVIRRGNLYYLLSGSWAPSYNHTRVFVTKDPLNFGNWTANTAVLAGEFESHAPGKKRWRSIKHVQSVFFFLLFFLKHFSLLHAEVFRDMDGSWWVTGAGWGMGGLFVSQLFWNDGLKNESDSSLPVPLPQPSQEPQFRTNLFAPNVGMRVASNQIWMTTSAGLSAFSALSDSFLESSVAVQGDHFRFSATLQVVTKSGNPGPGPWEREGSAAALCWFSGSMCANFWIDAQGQGGIKLFRMQPSYVALLQEEISNVTNGIDLELIVEAAMLDRGIMHAYWITGAGTVWNYTDSSPSRPWNGTFSLNVFQGSALFQDVFVNFE